MNKIKFGIVGRGWRVDFYMRIARNSPNLFEVVGVTMRQPDQRQKFEKKWGVKTFANINVTINATDYDPLLGQELSPLGTVIALEKSAAADEFFLTFERFGNDTHAFSDPNPPAPAAPVDPAAPVVSDIGFRTFDEINASISTITGIPVTNAVVDGVFDDYIQQLPTIEAIDAFLSSHQMAIAQLVLTSCSVLVDTNPGYFAPFDFAPDESCPVDSLRR